jgi:hypothetical protein
VQSSGPLPTTSVTNRPYFLHLQETQMHSPSPDYNTCNPYRIQAEIRNTLLKTVYKNKCCTDFVQYFQLILNSKALTRLKTTVPVPPSRLSNGFIRENRDIRYSTVCEFMISWTYKTVINTGIHLHVKCLFGF